MNRKGLNFLSKAESIETINGLAAEGTPFLFLTSFDGDNNMVVPRTDASKLGFHMELPGLSQNPFQRQFSENIRLSKKPVKATEYLKAFDKVIQHIHYGNSFLLNLTFPTPIKTNYDLQEIFVQSKAPFKLYIEGQLVVFSPERFISIKDGIISSYPMKGTIDASLPNAHMLLKSDRKEDAEHNTIVDLIRNDLSTIARDVRVRRFKYIEKIRTNQGELLQMSSEISGKLPVDFRPILGELLFRMLPAGSVSGAPKKKTVEIIREVEKYERGFYTGVFGQFDGNNLDSAVAIRYIEKDDKDGTLLFKSGGGITFRSNWKKEYDEMINKVYVPIY